MIVLRCLGCNVTWIGAVGPDDDAVLQAFDAHVNGHNIASPSPIGLAAPFPMAHGCPSVERGNIASRASVIGNDTHITPAKERHPSARLAAIVGGVA